MERWQLKDKAETLRLSWKLHVARKSPRAIIKRAREKWLTARREYQDAISHGPRCACNDCYSREFMAKQRQISEGKE